MKYQVLTEEELQTAALLPEGLYRYKVIKTEDKISQTGNEYIALTLKVWNDEDKEALVFTNLALIKLLKHLCDINNMQDDYISGDIPASKFMGKSEGRVMLGIEPEKPNGKGGVYPAKNIVKDYVVAPHGSTTAPLGMHPAKMPVDDFLNDEIPF